eukprot:363403-Chlamydomonas_euryale.AAC.11
MSNTSSPVHSLPAAGQLVGVDVSAMWCSRVRRRLSPARRPGLAMLSCWPAQGHMPDLGCSYPTLPVAHNATRPEAR